MCRGGGGGLSCFQVMVDSDQGLQEEPPEILVVHARLSALTAAQKVFQRFPKPKAAGHELEEDRYSLDRFS